MPVIEWLMTGVNAVLEAAILIPIISIMSVVLMMNSVQARDKAINADMRDYTAFNQYDETHVYPQDITAAILSYRGFPSVKVTLTMVPLLYGVRGILRLITRLLVSMHY